jgi:hypothetical protein
MSLELSGYLLAILNAGRYVIFLSPSISICSQHTDVLHSVFSAASSPATSATTSAALTL